MKTDYVVFKEIPGVGIRYLSGANPLQWAMSIREAQHFHKDEAEELARSINGQVVEVAEW